jgi:hypothetical protein
MTDPVDALQGVRLCHARKETRRRRGYQCRGQRAKLRAFGIGGGRDRLLDGAKTWKYIA